MDELSADDDLRALRGADPAAGVEASQQLRDRVAATPSQDADADAGPAPLRPRRRWILPAAAAAAVVAAIGAGYAWGTGGVDLGPAPVTMAVETGTPDDPAPPISGFSGAGAGEGSAVSDSAASGALPGTSFQSQVSTAEGARVTRGYGPGWWGSFGQQRFILPTLDTMAGQEAVYAVDARAQYSAEDATRMAAALGMTGDAREIEGSGGWVVGDYPGPRFDLWAWGGADASYSSGTVDPWSACDKTVAPGHDLERGGEEAWTAYDSAVQQCLKDTPMPTEEQAREALSLFLAATGVDEDETRITVTPDTASRTIMATAARVVGSNETEIVTHVGVSAQGIISGYGSTGSVVSLGEYPIVSPAEGAARLNDPAYSPRLVSWPEQEDENPDYTAPTAPPEVPGAGAAVPWAITEHEIVSARLGLALFSGADGVQYLAPAYEFTASDDTVWSVIALPEDQLDTAPSGIGFGIGWW